ncbi:MAG: GNAT family N-acetyltransferase [Campylobacteraceae bacterium]|nr:GNAT family N-acetyltransferase [Campylobacteraceae bacterium]
MSINIKKVSLNEVKEVAKVFNAYRVFYGQKSDLPLAEEFLKQRVQNNESVIFCIFDEENKALAFTQLYPSFSSVSAKRSWILNDLFVDENYRKRGYAKALMQKAKEMVQEDASKGIFLQTHKNNKNAQALYESLEYERDEEYYSYYLSL